MLVLHPHRAPNRARARYRLSLPSSSSPSSSFFLRMLGQVHSLTTVANRLDPKSRTTTKTRTITRKTRTCPKGATGLSPGFQPWEPHQNGCALMGRQTERTNNPEEAVDVMWLVHAGSPGSDGASPYRLDSSLFHPQSTTTRTRRRARTTTSTSTIARKTGTGSEGARDRTY